MSVVAFYVTGTCFGALNYTPIVGEDGTTSWGEIYPAGQKFLIASDRNATSRVTIVPRSAHGLEKANLTALYGAHMGLLGVDITMGADDDYGVVIYTGSTAELSSISVTGTGDNALGIDVVDGSVVQLGGVSEVTGVINAIRVKNDSLIRNKGTMYAGAKGNALTLDSSKWVDDEQGRVNLWGTSNGANSLKMENGAQASLNALFMGAYIRMKSASVAKINYVGSDLFVAGVQLLSSGLTIITGVGGNSNYDISRFACHGMSELNIDNLDVRNQGGNNCLDDTAWNAMINAAFP